MQAKYLFLCQNSDYIIVRCSLWNNVLTICYKMISTLLSHIYTKLFSIIHQIESFKLFCNGAYMYPDLLLKLCML